MKLDTAQAVIEWVRNEGGCPSLQLGYSASPKLKRSADYVAECVRWRKAWDKYTKKGTHYNLRNLPERMWAVMNPE